MEGQEPLLRLVGICKQFGGVYVNDHIDLDIMAGQVHALLGENGAGKSTLMNIIYGMYQPDAGQIIVDGKEVQIKSPKVSLQLFIRGKCVFVQQVLHAGIPGHKKDRAGAGTAE